MHCYCRQHGPSLDGACKWADHERGSVSSASAVCSCAQESPSALLASVRLITWSGVVWCARGRRPSTPNWKQRTTTLQSSSSGPREVRDAPTLWLLSCLLRRQIVHHPVIKRPVTGLTLVIDRRKRCQDVARDYVYGTLGTRWGMRVVGDGVLLFAHPPS